MKPQILLILSLASSALAAPPLLPFQGHLTQSNGEAVEDGAKVVQFKIYDAPVSGNAVWAGEVHKLSVNKGLVNTILGTKTAFPPTYSEGAKVMFSEPLYIEITVDADESQTITAADPPLLPRQVLLPANFAHVAHSIRAMDGSLVIKENGEIDGTKLKIGSIALESLASASNPEGGLSSNQIADGEVKTVDLVGAVNASGVETVAGAVTSAKIKDGEVQSADIANGTIKMEDLAAELLGQLNPPGTVQAFAGTSAPTGWVLCDGSDYPKTGIHEDLWETIRHTHGLGGTEAAPNRDRFRVPDYRGRFLRGVDGTDGSDADRDPDSGERLAMWFGGNTNGVGSVQTDALKRHKHGMANLTEAGFDNDGNGHPARISYEDGPPFAGAVVPYETKIVGSSQESRPKNAAVHFIIKL